MSEFTPLREAVESLASRSPSPDFGELARRATRRGRRRVVMVGAAAAALVAGSVLVFADLDGDRRPDPVQPPQLVVGSVPVWYDANGLHRGDVVEQTPVELIEPERPVEGRKNQVYPQGGALALVRTGAIYSDPATFDVWFHPWGGEPHIIGRNSTSGPGGDPDGDTAAWFDGFELVVFDTAEGREVSRTLQSAIASDGGGDHFPAGNTFLQVSAERVVWRAVDGVYSHEVDTQTTSVLNVPTKQRQLADVHDDVEVFGDRDAVLVKAPGRPERRYPDMAPYVARLSASGNQVLGVEFTDERHAAAIIDTRTGGLWRVPNDAYPWIAWSYGDLALLDTEDAVLACDPARRTCERLRAERPMLMPTN